MDEFARLPDDERRVYFEQAAAQLGLSAVIIEKDFWVCWCLRRLFSIDVFQDHLTFKGGTSLSKVYRIIDRFSEDVDIAIERGFLGFGGDHDPEKARSGKEQQRRIVRLKEACQVVVQNQLLVQYGDEIAGALPDILNWELSVDPGDPDQQSLLFMYPPAIQSGLSSYFPSVVKIELGARSDHYPVETAAITPYLAEAIPGAVEQATTQVRVLSPERTFWEKSTILHRLHHLPDHSEIHPRMSRHYYDIYQLSKSAVWRSVLESIELLDRVVEQTIVYFKRSWAKYDEARRGGLRLTPPARIVESLKRDYREMRPMFFNEPPSLDQILEHLPALEQEINSRIE